LSKQWERLFVRARVLRRQLDCATPAVDRGRPRGHFNGQRSASLFFQRDAVVLAKRLDELLLVRIEV